MSGFGMLGLVITLAIVAVGAAIGGTMLVGGSSGHGGSNPANPSIGAGLTDANKAYDIVTETSLETAESAVQTVATTVGYGSVSAPTLETAEPSIHFSAGPSTADTTVSVASSTSQSPSPGGISVPTTAGNAAAVGGSASGGGVTLAAFSESTGATGSCLFVWMASGQTWFGAEADQTSCSATARSSPPTAGEPTSTSIGWSSSSFPTP